MPQRTTPFAFSRLAPLVACAAAFACSEPAAAPNRAPVLGALELTPTVLLPGATANVKITADDPEKDALAFEWSATGGFTIAAGTEPGTATVTAPAEFGLEATVSVTVKDGKGSSTSAEAPIATRRNAAPLLASATALPPQTLPGGSIELTATASDADGDAVTITWSAPEGWVLSAAEGSTVSLEAPSDYGAIARVQVTAADPFGAKATTELVVSTVSSDGPRINSITADPTVAARGGTISLSAVATHRYDEPLTYEWTVPEGWTLVPIEADPAKPQLVAPARPGASALVQVKVSDRTGLFALAAVAVSTRANVPPQLSSVTADPAQAAPGATIALAAVANDPDDTALTYAWTAPEGWTLDGTGAQVQLTAHAQHEQTGTVHVTVEDAFGGRSAGQVIVSTKKNGGPSFASVVATPSVVRPGEALQLEAAATDPDGHELAYAWSAPEGWTLSSTEGASVSLTAPSDYGATARVRVTATDPFGGSATAELAVSTVSNDGPRIGSLVADPPIVARGGTVALAAVASHRYDEPLTYAWVAPEGWTLVPNEATPAQPQLLAPAKPGQSGVVQVTVSDRTGQSAVATVVVSTRSNVAPTLASVTADPQQAAPRGTIRLAAVANDADDTELTYRWSASEGWTIAGTGALVQLTAHAEYDRTGTVTVTVEDAFGGRASGQVVVSTRPNRAPVVTSVVATPPSVRPRAKLLVDVSAADPDGDALTYRWTLPAGWTGSSTTKSIELTAPDAYAADGVVRVEVTDGRLVTTGLVTVSTILNVPPVIVNLVQSATVLPRAGTATMQVFATDVHGDALAYRWRVEGEGWTISATDTRATVTAPARPDASARVIVEVEDAFGAKSTSETAFGTVPNEPVTISAFSATPAGLLLPAATVTVAVTAANADLDPLTYTWSAPAGWTIAGTGASVVVTAPDTERATATVKVVVDDGFGGSATRSVDLATRDLTPNAFAFTNRTGVDADVDVTSNAVAVAGFDGPVSATCTGCTLDVNGDGNFQGTRTGIQSGHTLRLRARSGTWDAVVTSTVTVGRTTSSAWSLTSRARDVAPDAFAFANQGGVAPGVEVISSSESVTGFEGTLTATCSGCQVSRNGGSFAASVAAFAAGDTIRIKVTSTATLGGTVTASVTLGSTTSATWTVTTRVWSGTRTFTTCGVSGQTGPSQAQCTTSYGSTPLSGEVSVTSGLQSWTVPLTGTYRIEAQGAQGKSAEAGRNGGRGARMRGDFALTQGQVLKILVGQEGLVAAGNSGGGGGGTFVVLSDDTPLVVAGGGGGTRVSAGQDGCPARAEQDGSTGSLSSPTGGCAAKGASTIRQGGYAPSSSWGSAGGGLSTDGAGDGTWGTGGRAFVNGGAGGSAMSCGDARGGFGGGGAGNGCAGGGGGGGYSGGDGGWIAGGGGSYNAGTNQSNAGGARTGQGQVTIDLL